MSHFCNKTAEKVAFLSKMWAADVPAAIYIYIYIDAVGGESGHIFPSRKGNLVPGMRPDSPRSGFALVL